MNDQLGDSFESNQELEGYRTLSRSALIALLIGLVSLVAVFTPVLALLPAIGIVFAILAFYQIERSKGQLGGTVVASLGLLLCATFLGWSVTANLTRQAELVRRATQLSEDFLSLIARGDKEKAHQLMMPPIGRVNNVRQIEQYYKEDSEGKAALAAAFSEKPLSDLVAWAGKYQFKLDSVVEVQQEGVADAVTLDFALTGEGVPAGQKIRITQRRIAGVLQPDGHVTSATWQVETVLSNKE